MGMRCFCAQAQKHVINAKYTWRSLVIIIICYLYIAPYIKQNLKDVGAMWVERGKCYSLQLKLVETSRKSPMSPQGHFLLRRKILLKV